MLKRIAAVSIVLALAVTGAAFAAAPTTGTKVTLHATARHGRVLATSTGRSLYLHAIDGRNKSRCTGRCPVAWPPLLTKGKPVAGKGVYKALLGTTRRSNGKLQVTYNGHPLYRYIGDAVAGETHGEGGYGVWYLVSAAGKKK